MDFIASLETDVTPRRSVAQIQDLVERFGARAFEVRYHERTGEPDRVRFAVVDPHLRSDDGAPLPPLTIELRAPTEALERVLRNRRTRTPKPGAIAEQARRIAWRHLHDVVRASLIGVQDGLLTVGEAFLAHLVVESADGTEETFGAALQRAKLLTPSASGRLLLGRGS